MSFSSIEAGSPIIVTPATLASDLTDGLTTDQSQMASLEEQIATGDAINVASDDPSGASNLLQLQASVTRANQYSANAQDGTGWLTLANSTVSSVLSVLQSTLSVVQGLSGSSLTGESSTLSTTASQVSDALNELTNLANTTYEGGQPLFAGTGNATAAYDENGNYLGAGSAPTRTVAPGTQVPVSVTGPTIFGTGTTGLLGNGSDGSPVGVLQQIVNDLNTGTSASINNVETTDLSNLQNAINQVEDASGTLGAAQDQVEGFSTQATNSVTSLEQELGAVQNTNMAQAITNLQLQQTSYQAALYATSQLSSDSLVQYL